LYEDDRANAPVLTRGNFKHSSKAKGVVDIGLDNHFPFPWLPFQHIIPVSSRPT